MVLAKVISSSWFLWPAATARHVRGNELLRASKPCSLSACASKEELASLGKPACTWSCPAAVCRLLAFGLAIRYEDSTSSCFGLWTSVIIIFDGRSTAVAARALLQLLVATPDGVCCSFPHTPKACNLISGCTDSPVTTTFLLRVPRTACQNSLRYSPWGLLSSHLMLLLSRVLALVMKRSPAMLLCQPKCQARLPLSTGSPAAVQHLHKNAAVRQHAGRMEAECGAREIATVGSNAKQRRKMVIITILVWEKNHKNT